jgi:nitrous oxidase accessory protein
MRRRFALIVAAALGLSLVVAIPAGAAEDLQSLIDEAEPGTVLVLPAGTYEGGVTVDKSLEIRGEGWPYIDGGGEGTNITITAPDVTLTGLVIANTGSSLDRENSGISVNAPRATITGNRLENVLFGIFLREADGSVVSDNTIGAMDVGPARRGDGIRLWESSQVVVERNQVDGGRDTVIWFSDDVIVRDNVLTGGRYGVHFMYSDNALVERNVLSDNSVGGFLMYSFDLTLRENLVTGNHGPSGYGFGLKDIDGLEVTGNRFIENRIGIYLDNSPATSGVEHHLTNNLFAYNEVGAAFLPSVEGNVFTGNAFVDNGEQVGVQGKGEFEGNIWTVEQSGNYWSDFAGYDADADGIGDVPYRLSDLFSTLTDNNPDLHFFDETPAAQAIDLAAHMFPTFRPRPKVEDTSPLIQIPEIPLTIPQAGDTSVWGTLIAALAMLGVAAALLMATQKPGRRVRT